MNVRVPKALSVRDPKFVAPLADLRYLAPTTPGWTRRRCGRGFSFLDNEGNIIRGEERDRLRGLAVPPAWENVWFAPIPDGYLQATGVDGAGRKQYRYHAKYRALREARKFQRLSYFGRAIPDLRAHVAEMLRSQAGSKTLAVGAALRMIDAGLVRVGNERSARTGHYGATTLAADHVDEDGYVALTYVAKGGKHRSVVIEDEQLGDILEILADHDEERLFTYDGPDSETTTVSASDVNSVIATVAGPSFSAKDFRTWGGSRQAIEARVQGREIVESVDLAAAALGNTRTVARSSYIHPAVIASSASVIDEVWRRSRQSATMSRGNRALLKLLTSDIQKKNKP